MERNSKLPDRRCRKTKSAIKNALLTLLKEKNISEISIKELAETADINRKTFYNHYTDLDDVLHELENEYVNRIFSLLENGRLSEYKKEPYLFFEKLSLSISSNIDFYRLLFVSERNTEIEKKSKKLLKSLLEAIIPKPMNTDSAKYNFFINFITAGIVSAYIEWLKDDNTDINALTHRIYDIIRYAKRYLDD